MTLRERGVGMGVVRVRKAELLDALKVNRELHRKVFLEALEGYREQAIAILEARLKEARDGRRIDVSIILPQPIDQTKEYNRVIRMLEMSVESEVELTEQEFAQYVMDDWRWKDQFLAVNSTYLKK